MYFFIYYLGYIQSHKKSVDFILIKFSKSLIVGLDANL